MAQGSLVAVPELQAEGPARLLALRPGGLLALRFLASGAEMTLERERVVRYILLPRTRVRVRLDADGTDGDGEILQWAPVADKRSGLLVYRVVLADGTEQAVAEDAIVAVPTPRDAGEQLLTGAFHDLCPRFGKTGRAREPEPWGPAAWCARQRLLAYRDEAWSGLDGVVGLAGARVEPLPHQFIIARRILADRSIRYLLADEVGLGKTIETGLVLQSLLAIRPNLRVLIVAPGSLVSQWFVELYVKFGGRRFLMLDTERLTEHRRGNVWEEHDQIIVSAHAVESLANRQALRFAQASWDLVIVDECHRMQPGGGLFKRVAILSKQTPHVLLLSATPGRQHRDAFLALLHLLQPDIYRLEDTAAFAAKLEAHHRIAELLSRTRTAAAQPAELGAAWRQLLDGDAEIEDLAGALDDDPASRQALVDYVSEHYSLDHRLLGFRRRVLADLGEATGVGRMHLAERSRELLTYHPEDEERVVRDALRAYTERLVTAHGGEGELPPRLVHWLLQLHLAVASHPVVVDRLLRMRATVLEEPEDFEEYRIRAVPGEDLVQVLRPDLSEAEALTQVAVSAACYADPPAEAEALRGLIEANRAWGKRRCRRLEVLIDRLRVFWRERPQEKVLVFTANAIAVQPLAQRLEAAFPRLRVETFGHHQETVAREDAVRRFEREDDCALMVSDPLGGEGRNFQYVSVVVHFDLPWSLAAVEQRIGRVDRLGRDGEVPSWVVVPADDGDWDRAWGRILDEAVEAFTRPSSGLEFIAGEVECGAIRTALRGGGAALAGRLDEFRSLLTEERDRAEAFREQLFHAAEATFARAAESTAALAAGGAPADAVCWWARGAGGSARRDDDRRVYRIRPRTATAPVDGVFERERALADPSLTFLAIGNELVDGLVEDASRADWCRATAWRRRPAKGCARWEGLRVDLAWALDLAPLVGRGQPVEVLRRVFAVAPSPRRTLFVRCSDAEREEDPAVLQHLAQPFDPRRGDAAISRAGSRDAWSAPFLQGEQGKLERWQAGVAGAIAAADDLAAGCGAQERRRVRELLGPVLDRGVALAESLATSTRRRFARGHPDAERLRREAIAERELREVLLAAVAGAAYRVDGLAYLVVA